MASKSHTHAAWRDSLLKLSRMQGRTPERQAERQNACRTPERLQNARQNARTPAERQPPERQGRTPSRTPGSPERQTQNARGPERQIQNAKPPQNARAERQGAERQIENARTPETEQNACRTPAERQQNSREPCTRDCHCYYLQPMQAIAARERQQPAPCSCVPCLYKLWWLLSSKISANVCPAKSFPAIFPARSLFRQSFPRQKLSRQSFPRQKFFPPKFSLQTDDFL